VPVPTWDQDAGPPETVRQIDDWLMSEPMATLVEMFGGNRDNAALDCLEAFAKKHWDFRGGRERDMVPTVAFSESVASTVIAVADALGLVEPTPPRRTEYDAALVLGGLVRACIVRPRFAASLVRSGLRLREVVALGAFRGLSKVEVELATRFDLPVTDEFTAMTEGMRAAFTAWLTEPPAIAGEDVARNASRSWRTVTWRPTDAPIEAVSVVAAPTLRRDADRANTAETYDFWVRRLKRAEIRSVLVITNPIYVPYQGSTAIESLGLAHGLDVETVGVSSETADLGPDTQRFEPHHYLQEIRSAIGALIRLRSALVGPAHD